MFTTYVYYLPETDQLVTMESSHPITDLRIDESIVDESCFYKVVYVGEL